MSYIYILWGLLCSLFLLKLISHGKHGKAYLLFSKLKIMNWEGSSWSQVTFLNTETPANQF